MTENNELLDMLIIDENLVVDETDLPQLIGGRAVVAQDIKHRVLDSGFVYQLIGERAQNVIRQILKRLELIVEDDLRVIAGTVKATYGREGSRGKLSIECFSTVGDVIIALPVIPEELLNDDNSGEVLEPRILFYLPRTLGAALSEGGETNDVEVISLDNAEKVVSRVVKIGNAELIVNDKDIKILEVV